MFYLKINKKIVPFNLNLNKRFVLLGRALQEHVSDLISHKALYQFYLGSVHTS